MSCMLWTVRLSRGCFEKRNTMGALKRETQQVSIGSYPMASDLLEKAYMVMEQYT